MTTISGSSLQPTHTVQEISNQATAQGIQQGHAGQRVGRVQSLASDGRELPLPDAVTQRATDADGQAVGKHKNKSRTLKNLFGMKGKHKAASPSHPNPGQRQSPGNGPHLIGADANLPADTFPQGERAGNAARSRPMTSRLMHQLGLKQRKAEQGAAQEAQRPATSTPLPGGFGSHSLLSRLREDNPQSFGHLDKSGTHLTDRPSRMPATPDDEPSLQEEDPEVSAHLEALRRRGASAFAPPRLETIPEGDEDEEDDASFHTAPGSPLRNSRRSDSFHSVGSDFPDEPPADKMHADHGKEPLFSPPHTTFEIGESSGASRPPPDTPSSPGDGSSSSSESLPEAADNLAEDHPEVSAHLEALRRRGASAFAPPRLETIPEGDEDEEDDASFHTVPGSPLRNSRRSDSFHSVSSNFPDEPSADKLRAGRGKEPLFSPPHTTFEIGESSGASRRPQDTPPSPGGGSSSSSESLPDAADSLKPPRLGVENGKLTIAPETPAPVATMLKETLGKASQSYVAHESLRDDRQQYLLDRTGRVFQVSTDPGAGLVAMHSSTAMLDAEQPPASLFGHLSEAGLPTGDPNYPALATGIHRDGNGDHWRVHDDKLHKLSSERQWHPDRPDINKLAPGRDGGLYGLQSSTQIIDLATGRGSETTPHPIAAFTIDRQGEVAQVLKPDNGGNNYLRLLPSLEASPEQALEVTPRYAPGTPIPGLKSSDAPELTSIAFSERALFAIDKAKQLLMAPLPRQGQSELHFQAVPQTDLHKAIGKTLRFEGFSPHGDGKLSALVRDRSNQLHACPLDGSGKTFRPGWNLSDILHIGNTRGLEPEAPRNLRLQDFGKHGQLGLADGKLYAKDKLTRQWTQVDEKIVGLQRGLDGQPYALQDGKLKKVGLEEKSSDIAYGDSNVFALTQTRGKATLKDGLKNAPKETLTAAAVLGQYRHVTLSEAGELLYTNVLSGTSSHKHPPVPIDTQGLEGNIKQLSIDKSERLFALTSEGKLYSRAADDWQKMHVERPTGWQPETLPHGRGDLADATLTSSGDHHAELILASGERLQRKDNVWVVPAPLEQEAPAASTRAGLFNSVIRGDKKLELPSSLPNGTVSTNTFGVTQQGNLGVNRRFSDRLSAHMNLRSMFRTPAFAVQHRWQGREGLRPLYEQERELFKTLDDLSNQLKSGQGPERGLAPEHRGMDLKTRLQRLDLGPEGSELKKTLESFRESLELSARNHLIKLGKHQGVLDHGGKLKLDYQTPKLKSSIQAFNPNRSGHDLSRELLALWRHCPASPDSDVGQLLKAFRETGVNMSHQATDVPLGRQRDPNDKMALSKSRLALDTLTLLELDQLVKKAEELSGQEATPERLKGLKRDLAELRDDRYENHRAKYYTDHSMSGHHDVEGRYDSAKAFIKAFSNPKHSINQVVSSALGSRNQEELNRDLKAVLHNLVTYDDVTLTRNYGTSVDLTVSKKLLNTLFLPISASVGQQRNYAIELNGIEDGVEVNLSRNLRHGGSVGVGTLKTTDLPGIGGIGSSPAGGALTLKGGHAGHDEFIFKLHGKEIDAFVDGLTSGQITPDALVEKGLEHVAMHGRKWDFDVDLSVNLGLRFDFLASGTDDDSATKNAADDAADDKNGRSASPFARMDLGLSANLSLFSHKKDNFHYEGLESTKHRINETSGFLNNASVTTHLGKFAAGANQEVQGDASIFLPGASASNSTTYAFDNSVKVRGEMKTDRAETVTPEEIDKLCATLTQAFHDPISQELLRGVASLGDVDERLSLLRTHFLDSGTVTHHDDEQYAALRSIESTSLQHQAASLHGEVMSAAKMVVSHANPHHLDHQGVLNFLVSLVSPSSKDALAGQIGDMMKTDPAFAAIVDDIRKPNCYTWVTLELKDEVRHRLEEDFLEGKTNLNKVRNAFNDPQNRRLKSITLLEKGEYKEGFTSPTPLIQGTSSASIYVERAAGTIAFTYGADQDTPTGYALSGEVVSSKAELAGAMTALKEQGLDMRDQ